MTKCILTTVVLGGFLTSGVPVEGAGRGAAWNRHTIDASSRGADGVRVADVNGDRLPDFVTGWEEGGRIRVCLHPGAERVKQPWPSVTVGQVRSPEDAVFVDLDGDGAIDVVSSCEGGERTMFVHWAPKQPAKYLDPRAWKTEAIPVSAKAKSWMYCLPLQVDGRHGIDLVAGAKGAGAEVGWFESPEDPRDLAAWRWHPIAKAGWIMSLAAADVDGDGDLDILTTDRKGPNRGCYWLENPGTGPAQRQLWTRHLIGGKDREVMFMTQADLDGDGLKDIVVAVKDDDLLFLRRTAATPPAWQPYSIHLPADTGTGKGIGVADLDLDGRNDVVFTCENAAGKSGVMWLSLDRSRPFTDADWQAHEISGREEGVKFDLIQLVDLDGDGDLDVVTCEERDNLGVVWYENPAR